MNGDNQPNLSLNHGSLQGAGSDFCNGLRSNENASSDTASEITGSLGLQPQGMICKGGTNSSSSPKVYFKAEPEVVPLKVEQRERVCWMSYLSSEEG